MIQVKRLSILLMHHRIGIIKVRYTHSKKRMQQACIGQLKNIMYETAETVCFKTRSQYIAGDASVVP